MFWCWMKKYDRDDRGRDRTILRELGEIRELLLLLIALIRRLSGHKTTVVSSGHAVVTK